ncbi:hypothetical protein H8959_003776, partial [Pygathrix nigripes]
SCNHGRCPECAGSLRKEHWSLHAGKGRWGKRPPQQMQSLSNTTRQRTLPCGRAGQDISREERRLQHRGSFLLKAEPTPIHEHWKTDLNAFYFKTRKGRCPGRKKPMKKRLKAQAMEGYSEE